MGTILIDKLLHTVVKRGASDLHITVGQPPALRVHGRMKRLERMSMAVTFAEAGEFDMAKEVLEEEEGPQEEDS